MSLKDIDGALIEAYLDLGLGLPTAYEGESFKPPTGCDWAAVSIVPAPTFPYTLGVNGEDLHTGFMQVDFFRPLNTGRAALIEYAQAAMDAFIAGKGFSRNGQNVLITSTGRSGIRQDGGFLRLTVTVNFEAATIRPEI